MSDSSEIATATPEQSSTPIPVVLSQDALQRVRMRYSIKTKLESEAAERMEAAQALHDSVVALLMQDTGIDLLRYPHTLDIERGMLVPTPVTESPAQSPS